MKKKNIMISEKITMITRNKCKWIIVNNIRCIMKCIIGKITKLKDNKIINNSIIQFFD